ncbi:MAG: hypothetical protein ACI86M_000171 [Saprospiraceae bacterium]|jgi:hypothetical protein
MASQKKYNIIYLVFACLMLNSCDQFIPEHKENLGCIDFLNDNCNPTNIEINSYFEGTFRDNQLCIYEGNNEYTTRAALGTLFTTDPEGGNLDVSNSSLRFKFRKTTLNPGMSNIYISFPQIKYTSTTSMSEKMLIITELMVSKDKWTIAKPTETTVGIELIFGCEEGDPQILNSITHVDTLQILVKT